MIYHVSTPRLAIDADIPRIMDVLAHPEVASSFGALTVEGKPWDEAFEDLAWWVAPGIVMAAEIRRDWSAWVHVAALPWARGKPVVDAARYVIEALFSEGSKVKRLAGWTPDNLRAAHFYNRSLGFTPRMRRKGKVLFMLKREEWESDKVKHG